MNLFNIYFLKFKKKQIKNTNMIKIKNTMIKYGKTICIIIIKLK